MANTDERGVVKMEFIIAYCLTKSKPFVLVAVLPTDLTSFVVPSLVPSKPSSFYQFALEMSSYSH